MVAVLPDAQLEALARYLGDCGSGSDIDRALASCGLRDSSGESTKWKRLLWVFTESQKRNRNASQILDFIRKYIAPVRFVGRSEHFEGIRQELNAILAFAGIEFGDDGKFRERTAAQTLTEAEKRLKTIRSKFQGRPMHPEVLKYCRTELLQDNYFHAVFEASKGLAQRLRDMTGADKDGAALVDQVFSVERPVLALNSLQTDTERSEHKGFAQLLKGCFGAVRNPLAHQPKVLWQGEDDAADYLSLISLLHRKLDESVLTGNKP
jgi:uncharacterized protein (TIGR02391 family)